MWKWESFPRCCKTDSRIFLCNLRKILVEIERVQQQKKSVNCGLFAVVFASSLAFGEYPANVTFDSKKLRMYLIKCFDEKQITCFHESTEKGLKISVHVSCN